MSSFFGRFKSGTPSALAASSAKKDVNTANLTPLERLLANAGPLRNDGSDKFFGYENFGSTCYCNSIIQCLYFSTPFREQVINYPRRSNPETIEAKLSAARNSTEGTGTAEPKGKPATSSLNVSPRKPGATPGAMAATAVGIKVENKETPEDKKRKALEAGPVLRMDYDNSAAYDMKESLFTSLKDIFEAVIAHKSRTGIVSPNSLIQILKRENEMFRAPVHQDAHEFLNILLNVVSENVAEFEADSKKPEDTGSTATSSVVSALGMNSLFEGTLTSETRCLTCETTSHRDEVFLDLSVDLDQHASVTSCLRKFSEEEMLCERNKFHCDMCGGLQEAEKRMKIKRLPKILALHLKRFKYTEDLQRLHKLFHRVVYPYHLRLFNTTDDAEDPDRIYELYAVVVHIGNGPYHGHYVSIVKTEDRGWVLFDDEMVEPVERSYVRNFFGGESSNMAACAYVLFYKETTMEAVQREEAEVELADEATEAAKSKQPNGSARPPTAGGLPLVDELLDLAHISRLPTAPEKAMADSSLPVGAPPNQLEQTRTAPPVSLTSTPAPTLDTALSPTLHSTSPATAISASTPTSPFFGRMFKEDRAKKEEERARKVAEKQRKEEGKEADKKRKETEKEAKETAKVKKKEAEEKLRDNHKKAQEEFLRSINASRAARVEEEKRARERNATVEASSDPSESPVIPNDSHEHTPVLAANEAAAPLSPQSHGRHHNILNPLGLSLPKLRDKDKDKDKAQDRDSYTSQPGAALSTTPLMHPTSDPSTTTTSSSSTQPNHDHKEGPPDTKAKENGGIVSAGISRFRQSSMSLRHKPRFWSAGSRDSQSHAGSAANHTTSNSTARHSHHANQDADEDSGSGSESPANMTALPQTKSPPLPPIPPLPSPAPATAVSPVGAGSEGHFRSKLGFGKKKSTAMLR